MAFPTCVPDATNVATPAESDNIFCIQAEIRAIKEYLRDNAFAEIPTGAYTNYIGIDPPAGWIFASQEVSRTTYADLFALIGISYGAGDSTTTFDLPNLYDVAGTAVEVTYSNLPTTLSAHTINQLPDGRLVLIGGFDGSSSLSSVYFGTISGTGTSLTITWAAGTAMPAARTSHDTIVTATGELLVCGGYISGSPTPIVYKGVISGNTVTWSSVTASISPSGGASVVALVPGHSDESYMFGYTSNTMLAINHITGLIRSVAYGATHNRTASGCCLLSMVDTSAMYLLAGGKNGLDASASANCYIVFVPAAASSMTFVAATPLPTPLLGCKAYKLADGRVLVTGKASTGFDPLQAFIGEIQGSTILWEEVTTALTDFLGATTMSYSGVQLSSGAVLKAGGVTTASAVLNGIESWRPSRVIIKT